MCAFLMSTSKPGKVRATPLFQEARGPLPPSRQNRVLIGAHFAPEVQTALKVLAAQERVTLQALLTEGIDMVFAKRGLPVIADLSSAK